MPKRNRTDEIDRSLTPTVDSAILSRVIKRRRRDFDSLGATKAAEILAHLEGIPDLLRQKKSVKDDLELLFHDHVKAASDPSLPAASRRASWNIINSIVSQIDTQLGREVAPTVQQSSTTASATNSFASGPAIAAIPAQRNSTSASKTAVAAARPMVHPAVGFAQLERITSVSSQDRSSLHGNGSSDAPSHLMAQNTTATSTNGSTATVEPSVQKNLALSTNSSVGSTTAVHPDIQQRNPSNATAAPLVQLALQSKGISFATNGPVHPIFSTNQKRVGSLNGAANPSSQTASEKTSSSVASDHERMQQNSIPAATRRSDPAASKQQAAAGTKRVATQSSTTRTAGTAASKENEIPGQRKAVATKAQPPIEPEIPVVDPQITTVKFPKGEGRLSGALHERLPCQVEFRKLKVPKSLMHTVGVRLASSEPYWYVVKGIFTGMTSPTGSSSWVKSTEAGISATLPRTVATFKIRKISGDVVKMVKNWGTKAVKPEEGEYRLLLRMLPVNKETKGMKRADCHLWPKGTFVTVGGTPHYLTQRSQQAHDKKKWLGMCTHFDMGTAIKFPLQEHTVNICCRDTDQYYFSLTICQYRSPGFLTRKLQGLKPECDSMPRQHSLQYLSLQESINKAKQFLSQPMVVLDDDDDDQTEGEGVGKFVFSLIDPLSKVPMKTPVRGNKCKHWQVRTFSISFKSKI